MELSKLDYVTPSEIGYEFEFISEALGSIGVFITVIGSESETVKNLIRKELNISRQRNKMREKRGKDDIASVEDDEKLGLAISAAKVIGWRGIVENGEPWPYSKENALRLLSRNPEILAQVNKESGELTNFIKSK